MDKGDYYYLNTGEEASFLRLKNTYLMIFHKKQTNASQIHKTVMSQFKDKLNIIKDRFSDKYLMFRVEEMENPREIITELFQVDKSIKFISPVLTTKAGGGDIALTPSIIFSITGSNYKRFKA